jgi:hypothetical protein
LNNKHDAGVSTVFPSVGVFPSIVASVVVLAINNHDLLDLRGDLLKHLAVLEDFLNFQVLLQAEDIIVVLVLVLVPVFVVFVLVVFIILVVIVVNVACAVAVARAVQINGRRDVCTWSWLSWRQRKATAMWKRIGVQRKSRYESDERSWQHVGSR